MSRRVDPDVPRLPRGRGLRLGGPQLVRIAMVVTLLVAVVILQRPCADAVSRFVTGFDAPAAGDGGAPEPRAVPDPGAIVDDHAAPDPYQGDYVEIKPGMSDEEVQRAIEEARRRGAGQGAGATPTPGPEPAPAAPR